MLQPVQTFLSSAYDLAEEGYENFLKKPLFLLGDHGKKVGGLFLGLPRRQAIAVYGGLLWVVPIAMVTQFESLYMVRLGLSETEVGVYKALMNIVGLAGFFIGGYVADFWGRHKAIVLFDSISWGGYCLSLAFASGKWWCVSAMFFMALVSASVPAYYGLLSEGITSRKRTVVFTVLQIVNQAPFALFFPLLGGLWVDHSGFFPANHQMYGLFTALVGVGVFLRWRLLPESKAYEKPPASWFHGLREGVGQYRRALGGFLKKTACKELLFCAFLNDWILNVWAIYASLYYVNHLGLRDSNLSVIQQGSTYVGILILFVLIPNLTQKFMTRILGLDHLFGIAALLILLLNGGGGSNPLLVCLISAGLGAVGNALHNSITVSTWMNIVQEKERAKVVAACMALIKVGLVTGSLGALLYGKVSPFSLLWLMIGLRILGFVLLRRVSSKLELNKKRQRG